MVKSYRVVWLAPILLLTIASIVPRVNAQQPTLKIYPSEGTIYTDIYLEARDFPPVIWRCWVFWDDKVLMEDVYSENLAFMGLNLHIYPPNEYPYSNLGNHTITIRAWYSGDSFDINATFEIVQYFPPTSEWWKWWETVPNEIKANLTGPQGPQGLQGETGLQGIQGVQGLKGDKGDKGDTGPYPIEAVQLNLSLSAVSVVTFIISASLLYKTKKLAHST